jgi:hypothetical protein
MLRGSLVALLLLALTAGVSAQQEEAVGGPAPQEISYIQDPLQNIPLPQKQLAYSVVIENRRGGLIRVVEPPASFLFNRPGVNLGTVLQPVRRVRTEHPAAALPAPANVLLYSGTDALHIKAWTAEAQGTGAVLSILPTDNVNYMPAETADRPWSNPGDVLLTDIPAGKAIFGGAYPLLVGNPVNIYRGQNILDLSPTYPDIEVGDMIVIGVYVPLEWPDDLRLENTLGGSVEWNLAGESLLLARCSLPQSTPRRSDLQGPLPAAGIARVDSTSFMIGLTGGDGRQSYGVNAQGFGNSAGLQLKSVSEVALPWQAPLFNGYLYPWNPADPPALLPLPVLRVRFGSGSSWVPLASVLDPASLHTVTALRIDWLPVGTVDESRVLTETPRDLEIGPAK